MLMCTWKSAGQKFKFNNQGWDLPPQRAVQSVRSESWKQCGNLSGDWPLRRAELFFNQDNQEIMPWGLEFYGAEKGTLNFGWGNFHPQAYFLLPQAHTFWWGSLPCWHPSLELSWHVDPWSSASLPSDALGQPFLQGDSQSPKLLTLQEESYLNGSYVDKIHSFWQPLNKSKLQKVFISNL